MRPSSLPLIFLVFALLIAAAAAAAAAAKLLQDAQNLRASGDVAGAISKLRSITTKEVCAPYIARLLAH